MPHWTDAVVAVPSGTRLLLDATPGAKQARFPDGFDPWRGRIGIKVREAPENGEATAAVVRVVAEFVGVHASSVTVESGALDRRKSLLVAVPREHVVRLLEPCFT